MPRKFVRSSRFSPSPIQIGLLLLTILAVIVLTRQAPQIPSAIEDSTLPAEEKVFAAPDSLYNAWETSNESCSDWISSQVRNKAYVDAYVVGSQKAGTTQVAQMLESLGVRRKEMLKEWHFYNHLTADGIVRFGRFETDPFPSLDNLTHLQIMHYQLGFPEQNITSLPPIDDSPVNDRTVVIDSTVEYFHMERAAALSSLLTPHVRIIIMIRDPPTRALSQYNMLIRIRNNRLRKNNQPDEPSSAEEFDKKVRDEVDLLRRCGYDDKTATLEGNTTGLIHCMRVYRPRIDDVMYVLRGLYFLHIPAWREHFADNRLLFVPFADLTRGYEFAYQRIANFLCVRPFTEHLMASVRAQASDLSYGERAMRDGLSQLGADTYVGNDRYLPDMWNSTRKLLDEFYAPANQKLTVMLGRPMYNTPPTHASGSE